MLDTRLARIRERLVSAASNKQMLCYQEAGDLVGLSMGNPHERGVLANLLDSISRAEHEAGRPLLSAVVVRKGQDQPGAGFFKTVRELGLHYEDEAEFFSQQLNAVWDYWAAADH